MKTDRPVFKTKALFSINEHFQIRKTTACPLQCQATVYQRECERLCLALRGPAATWQTVQAVAPPSGRCKIDQTPHTMHLMFERRSLGAHDSLRITDTINTRLACVNQHSNSQRDVASLIDSAWFIQVALPNEASPPPPQKKK